mmetsp:Transcript_37354/g.74636  ORF Transcript_37354/g.74636 Transcript_37354/m.74636 type:complete len:237 (-) Transcript_37354:4718-5428(-)
MVRDPVAISVEASKVKVKVCPSAIDNPLWLKFTSNGFPAVATSTKLKLFPPSVCTLNPFPSHTVIPSSKSPFDRSSPPEFPPPDSTSITLSITSTPVSAPISNNTRPSAELKLAVSSNVNVCAVSVMVTSETAFVNGATKRPIPANIVRDPVAASVEASKVSVYVCPSVMANPLWLKFTSKAFPAVATSTKLKLFPPSVCTLNPFPSHTVIPCSKSPFCNRLSPPPPPPPPEPSVN